MLYIMCLLTNHGFVTLKRTYPKSSFISFFYISFSHLAGSSSSSRKPCCITGMSGPQSFSFGPALESYLIHDHLGKTQQEREGKTVQVLNMCELAYIHFCIFHSLVRQNHVLTVFAQYVTSLSSVRVRVVVPLSSAGASISRKPTEV